MTTEKDKISYNVPDGDSCLVWLDRSYMDLLQLKRKLGSYLFEPTTFTQFEIKQQLCDKMDILVKGHMELIKLAKGGRKLLGKQIEMIQGYLAETRVFEGRVQEYMTMMQSSL